MNKKGKINLLSPSAIISGVIMLVVLFTVLTTMLPQLTTSLSHFSSNNSTVPFISFFSSTGIIVLVLMAGVLLAIIGWLGFRSKK